MRRLPVLAFSLFALLALSACAIAHGGRDRHRQHRPDAGGASEPAASAPAAGGGGCSTSSEAAAVTVNIQNFAFDPPEVTAAVGETIGWTNADSAPHTATTDDGGVRHREHRPGRNGRARVRCSGDVHLPLQRSTRT